MQINSHYLNGFVRKVKTQASHFMACIKIENI